MRKTINSKRSHQVNERKFTSLRVAKRDSIKCNVPVLAPAFGQSSSRIQQDTLFAESMNSLVPSLVQWIPPQEQPISLLSLHLSKHISLYSMPKLSGSSN